MRVLPTTVTAAGHCSQSRAQPHITLRGTFMRAGGLQVWSCLSQTMHWECLHASKQSRPPTLPLFSGYWIVSGFLYKNTTSKSDLYLLPGIYFTNQIRIRTQILQCTHHFWTFNILLQHRQQPNPRFTILLLIE